MRRLKQWLIFKYFQWKIRRLMKDMYMLFKRGNVRQMRQVAEAFKAAGKKYDDPDFTKLGVTLDQCAEKIVLRRIGFK